MPAPQMIVVSLPGSGTPLLAEVTTALGYTSYGTMSGDPSAGGGRPGPGEVYPLLSAAYGPDRGALLLNPLTGHRGALESAFHEAVSTLWRVWWTRLGQPTTLATTIDPETEARLTRLPDSTLLSLLPGRGCWYLTGLNLHQADPGFLRAWHEDRQPPVVFHHRDVRDRIISQIHALSQPPGRVGSMPENLVYRDVLAALPTMDAKITLALTDPGFPGMLEARHCQWLLRHPAVCVITHEELAGHGEPADGTSGGPRQRALIRLLHSIGHPAPAEAAAALPPAASRADDVAVGTGRELFTPEHERLLRLHHGHLLHVDPSGAPAAPDHRGAIPAPAPAR